MSEFWRDKIKAFLHDSPDKALILFHKPYERKIADIWESIGLKEDAEFLRESKSMQDAYPQICNADIIASSMQRLAILKDYRMDDTENCDLHICFKGKNKPIFKHTLSGAEKDLEEAVNFSSIGDYEKVLEKHGFKPEIVKAFSSEDWKKTYFLLWRFLPDQYELGYILPADTRIPDHSIWDHLDISSAIFSSLEGGLCLLSLKIPAVQEFITQSRKLSDLWASSHIFSTVIFEGIKAIVEKLGPDVVIYPQLRGNPMVDLTELSLGNRSFTMYEEGEKLGVLEGEIEEKLFVANFPNVFLALVPAVKVSDIANIVEKRIKDKWREIAEKAKELLKTGAKMLIDEKIWDRQISNSVEVTSAWVGFLDSNKFENLKDDIPGDLRRKQEELLSFVEGAGGLPIYGYFYYLTYELLGAILSQKSRFWNAWEEELITGKKCLMCGRRNALIERFRERGSDKEYYRYWQGYKWEKRSFEEVDDEFRYLLKERERLCAVCLTKRLYGWRRRSVFKEIFGVESPKQESVVLVAARDFIEKSATHPVLEEIVKRDAELIYEHEWGESEERIPEEKREAIEGLKKKLGKSWKELKDEVRKIYEQLCEKPNKYYAILMMDGDRIGKMLSGETLVNLGEFLHPVFKKKILEWEKGKDLVSAKRILTPSHHIAISRAMKDFSLYKVPEIIKEYKGFLVYAGGDDVLALLPTNRVLNAAYEIQKAFKEDFYEIEINGRRKEVMGLGKRASMSAGIIFAHYKWALYDAVEKVREAEKRAKNKYGRNAFCMTFIKHSGEILVAGGKWDFVTNLIDIAEVVTDGKISHRFIYDFMDVAEILEGDMLKAETKRLLRRRAEKVSDDEIKKLQEKLLHLIEKYWSQGFSIKELGAALKILYDAYRGEEG